MSYTVRRARRAALMPLAGVRVVDSAA